MAIRFSAPSKATVALLLLATASGCLSLSIYLFRNALETHPALTLDTSLRKEPLPIPLSLRERLKGGTLGHGQEKRFILREERSFTEVVDSTFLQQASHDRGTV